MTSSVPAADRPVLLLDMDNVLVDFASGIARLDDQTRDTYIDRLDEVPGIFALMDPLEGAIYAYHRLVEVFDVFIVSTAPWNNPSAWSDKVSWVHRHLGLDRGTVAYKRLMITHRKDLVRGDILVDDRTANGAGAFPGELVRFGQEPYATWEQTLPYLLSRAAAFDAERV